MAMRSDRFFDMPSSSILRPELEWFEPVNVHSVEEHEPNHAGLFVDLEWCARKNDSFQIYSV